MREVQVSITCPSNRALVAFFLLFYNSSRDAWWVNGDHLEFLAGFGARNTIIVAADELSELGASKKLHR
jgi:hypothetical protein